MTQDEIIEMARKAGCIPRRHPEYWENVQVFATPDVLVAFAKLVDAKATAKEREACAIVCDDINAKYKWPDDVAERVASQWCADSIRARGQA